MSDYETPNNISLIQSFGASCAYKVHKGINYPGWQQATFEKNYKAGIVSAKGLIITAAYGPKAGGVHGFDKGMCTDEDSVRKRLAGIEDFYNRTGLAEIYEIPEFQNGKYGRIITWIAIHNMEKVKEYAQHGWTFTTATTYAGAR
jgi:hypothetical protein